MAKRPSISVSLPASLRQYVDSRIRAGDYSSASELVGESIRLLRTREHLRLAAINAVKQKITEGLEASRRGEVVNASDVFDEWDEAVAADEATLRKRRRSA